MAEVRMEKRGAERGSVAGRGHIRRGSEKIQREFLRKILGVVRAGGGGASGIWIGGEGLE